MSKPDPGSPIWQALKSEEVENDPEVHGEIRIQRRIDGSYRFSTTGLCPEYVYYAVMAAYWQQRLQMLKMWQPDTEVAAPTATGDVQQ